LSRSSRHAVPVTLFALQQLPATAGTTIFAISPLKLDSAVPGRLDILPLGDRAAVIEVADRVGEPITARVRALFELLQAARLPGVREVVPSFCSVTLHYDPRALWELAAIEQRDGRIPFDVLRERVRRVLERFQEVASIAGRLVEIPVCYGGDYGEDLGTLALAHELAPSRLVELHAAPVYFVGMLGFMPGFPYLCGLDERLITPRRGTPRPRVPAGSVAIGGEHTGIYPLDSPGGWHVIGRTPVALFDVRADPPCLLLAGDRVRFVPISAEEFERLASVRGCVRTGA
jgi:inhibitor of KinA